MARKRPHTDQNLHPGDVRMTFNSSHLEPWRKWGSSEVVRIEDLSAPASGLTFGRVFANLINVEYFRPDTWTLMLGVELQFDTGATFLGSPAPQFNISLGLGQLNYTINRAWQPIMPVSIGSFTGCYTTKPHGTVNTTGGTQPIGDILVDPTRDLGELPAQSMQVQGQFDFSGTGSCTIQFVAMAAPRSHIRPEWFVDEADPWGKPL